MCTSLRPYRETVRLVLEYEREILVCAVNKFYKYSATSLDGDSVFFSLFGIGGV